ncbi:MAG: hypothetical protein MK108_15215 [Mariniblastus sp.]|nr:hypothetical protein [Mariniblastus sp.]
MKTFKFIASTLMAFGYVGAISAGFADAQIHGNFNRSTGFYTEANAKVLQRPGGGSLFTVAEDAITQQPLLTSSDVMDLGGGAGVEARIGWRNRVGGHWEFRTSLGKIENNKSNIEAPSLGGVTSPFFVPPAPGEIVTVDSVSYDYSSEFYSIELTRRYNKSPGFTWFWGPRFISLKEEFNFGTFSDFGLAAVTTNNQFKTSNSLIGGQVGFDITLPVGQNFICTGFVRTGAYGNPVVAKSKLTTFGPIGPQGDQATIKQEKGIGSFVGEVGGTLYYQIVPNVCSSFVGYEATWIDGVALAPTQALSVGETEPVTNNTPFWHAINFGLRFSY